MNYREFQEEIDMLADRAKTQLNGTFPDGNFSTEEAYNAIQQVAYYNVNCKENTEIMRTVIEMGWFTETVDEEKVDLGDITPANICALVYAHKLIDEIALAVDVVEDEDEDEDEEGEVIQDETDPDYDLEADREQALAEADKCPGCGFGVLEGDKFEGNDGKDYHIECLPDGTDSDLVKAEAAEFETFVFVNETGEV